MLSKAILFLGFSTLSFASPLATTTFSAPPSSRTCAKTLPPPPSAGKLSYVGVNIAGFDFGCGIDGTCTAANAWAPLAEYYGHDGAGQMQHFVKDDGFNTFRLPVGWQFLTNDVQGGALNATNFAKYDTLVKACLATGASCVIDIHNYARYNGSIIGQGGPVNAQFAQLWSNLASHYRAQDKVIFGLMNEPHDVPDIKTWADTVQQVVFAIRRTGATRNKILLPGNNWASAGQFISSGSADALNRVINLDGTKHNLIFDVHKYLDSDNSGTHDECVTNNIEEAWKPLAQWLRCNGRQAFNTETGGGNTDSCVKYLCQQIAFQAQNSDVFLGYVGWAAGNFDTTYILSEVPTQNGTEWSDTLLTKSCIAPKSGSQKGPIS